MSTAVWEPGVKTHRDENFPVASNLVAKRHRAPIMAFYRFARASDDVADHPNLSETQKIEILDRFEATLLGSTDDISDALPLRAALADRNLSPKHAQDLLVAFRWDASKLRYESWDDLIRYCTYSAMPVGRFVLDVHEESRDTWLANDALCAALQIINHLQDCGPDYKRLNRVYIPQDVMDSHGVRLEMLGARRASPELRACLVDMAQRTKLLLNDAGLSARIADFRLALEVAAIQRLATKLVGILLNKDPLSEKVHLTKAATVQTALVAVIATTMQRSLRRGSARPALGKTG